MNIQQLMKQAQAVQKKVNEAQEKLALAEYEGASGGGLVKAVVTGKGDFKKLKIDATLVDPQEIEMLEDLIVAAYNNAKKDADEASSGAMSSAMGGMGLPAGFKMPF